ncbi:hypothetical protein T492DRAFT_469041 [Pavlovales sp. CCMP2436]|nr:hypothetical protein T492DRAFT_469041 [Pavlovales sp. CCMP2436]
MLARLLALWIVSLSHPPPAFRYGAVEPLAAALLNPATRPAMMRNATWAVSNLCRGKPPPRPPLLAAALPALAMLLWAQDEEALADTCWAYAYLSDSLHPGPGGELSTGGGPVGGGYSGTFTADGGMIMDEGGQGGGCFALFEKILKQAD